MLRVVDTGVPGFEVLIDVSQSGAMRHALGGAIEADQAVAETIRIEAGVPRFGQDMDDETIPLEAGLESTAISTTKGCYVGQEVIIRVLHRGHGRIARKLAGLRLEGSVAPAPGASVTAHDRDAGIVTSATVSPSLNAAIALAYLHRDFQTPGTTLHVGGFPAVVTPLPFVETP